MTESRSQPDEEASARIATHFARAFAELQQSLASVPGMGAASDELRSARAAIEDLASRLKHQLDEDREQRRILGDQLTALASSLDRLVNHLQGLSQLMGDLLERLASPAAPPAANEPSFPAGGEGVSLTLISVPGFQALMDIQKALTAMPQVAGASVERYQEGDARVLVHLKAPLTAAEVAGWLRSSTPYAAVVEEAKPELSRLRLKVVPASTQ